MANNKTKVVTGLVRLSYANVWEPKAANENAQPKYSVSIIIPKSDKETLKKINDAFFSRQLGVTGKTVRIDACNGDKFPQ